MGTVGLSPLVGLLTANQFVATPFMVRSVFVVYLTTTAVIWILVGLTFEKKSNVKQLLVVQFVNAK